MEDLESSIGPLVNGLNGDILHLHLKYEHFDDIASGKKPKEYRDADKWKKRLDSKNYVAIRLYRGFQKVAANTVIDVPYLGYELETITHPHFGNVPKLVCAINITLKRKTPPDLPIAYSIWSG